MTKALQVCDLVYELEFGDELSLSVDGNTYFTCPYEMSLKELYHLWYEHNGESTDNWSPITEEQNSAMWDLGLLMTK